MALPVIKTTVPFQNKQFDKIPDADVPVLRDKALERKMTPKRLSGKKR